ncbi:MAG: hypothetical protein HS102_07920 [Planctomycetia bacterium]|nr:MAG: hypothetical protein EDM74_06670 [Armatimonadota bacterium]MBE7456541.1 hypothetical protein [Planctomycetia bacterium]
MEVSGDELVKIVQSKEFRYRLAKAARITMRTGHESGFAVYREPQSINHYWTPVFEGDTVSIEGEVYKAWERREFSQYPDHDAFDLLKLHFHTAEDGNILPSDHDLLLLDSYSFNYATRPIIGVAGVRLNEGHILLLQKIFTGSVRQTWCSIAGELADRLPHLEMEQDPHELSKQLSLPGYIHAACLPFRLVPGPIRATLDSPFLMNRFAYSLAKRACSADSENLEDVLQGIDEIIQYG